jgi:hypothetical protein
MFAVFAPTDSELRPGYPRGVLKTLCWFSYKALNFLHAVRLRDRHNEVNWRTFWNFLSNLPKCALSRNN